MANEIFKKRRQIQREKAELEKSFPEADINQKRTEAVRSTRGAILKRRAKDKELEKLGSDLAKVGQGDYRYVRGRIDDIYENAYDQVSDKMIMDRLEISEKEFKKMSPNQVENVKSRMAWRFSALTIDV